MRFRQPRSPSRCTTAHTAHQPTSGAMHAQPAPLQLTVRPDAPAHGRDLGPDGVQQDCSTCMCRGGRWSTTHSSQDPRHKGGGSTTRDSGASTCRQRRTICALRLQHELLQVLVGRHASGSVGLQGSNAGGWVEVSG